MGEGIKTYLKVQFENDLNRVTRDLTRYSLDIARYDTLSKGDEWRLELKTGDLIDAFDSTKAWYAATIMGVSQMEENERIIPQVKVGFRMYHPEGNKEDENTKEKFFGWSERFDEWMSVYSPRI